MRFAHRRTLGPPVEKEWGLLFNCVDYISIRCKTTGDLFLGISKDTRADFNSNRFRLSANGHSNRQLQELWS